GKVSPRFQADCLTPNGLALRLGFTIAPLSSESGETTGMVITFQDLTDIRALEETSRRQDRLAAVGRMAASIAHEIRNPLAAMRGLISDTFKLLRNSDELLDGHKLEDHLPDRPAIVSGDPEQLKQVCWNIARNALKAMPEGGKFRASLEEVDGHRLRLSFTD